MGCSQLFELADDAGRHQNLQGMRIEAALDPDVEYPGLSRLPKPSRSGRQQFDLLITVLLGAIVE
jgi:hypothetical protein